MIRNQKRLAISGIVLAFALGGCAQQGGYSGGSSGGAPAGSQGQMSNTSKGAIAGGVIGALAGGLTQGHDKAKRALIGAGIGALAGAAVGNYMDRQEQQMRQQLAGSGVEVSRQGDNVVLNLPENLTFDTGSAKLKPAAQAELNKVAAVLKQNPQTVVDVSGHTDSTGSDAVNNPLSQKRAGAVAAYLVRDGVPQSRLVVNGYGASRPIADNATDAGRAANRRVEITLLPLTQG